MTLGVFAVILSMRRSDGMVELIDQLAGLARTHPTMAFFLAMLLFSMAGVPPLAGFFAKFYVFLAAIKAGLYVLAVIGVLASVVGAYYYLAIVKIMYFDEPAEGFYAMPIELKVVLAVCGLFNILFFLYPGPLVGDGERGRPFAVLMQLDPAAATAGFRLVAHETLASTNAEALAAAHRGERGPLWITARRQTAGRGRRGNAMDFRRPAISTPRSCSAIRRPREHAPELSFVAALAVHDAILDRARAAGLRAKLALKWPNDLLCGGAKLAGILIEGESSGRECLRQDSYGKTCRRHRHRRQLHASSRADDLSGDRSGGGRRRCLRRKSVCGAVRRDAAPPRAMAAAAPAFPPSAPTGSTARPGSAATCACGFQAASFSGAARRSMSAADCCCALPTAACTRSRPATYFRSMRGVRRCRQRSDD